MSNTADVQWREYLISQLDDSPIARLATALSADPWCALENSGEAFEQAARLRVAGRALRMLDAGSSMSALRREALMEVLRGAGRMETSTDAIANHARRCMVAAWSWLLSTMPGTP